MENFLDDRFIIPEYIKNMTKEELEAEIQRLEQFKKIKEKENNNV